ncbi:class I SAM-dependent methyltransferase [Streptomyces sp. NPDC005385]|uniref:O-methyltransferase n=1 Tax=Streptomyces sp. NPDC005385 TaxID=3157039 RepID=UPI0033B71AFA
MTDQPRISAFARSLFGPREPLLDTVLRDALQTGGLRPMQVDDNAARVLQLLTLLHRPRRVLEIGTFFGFSAIHIARGLPDGGRLSTLEVDADVAATARRNLAAAGVADRVDVVVGPAADHLRTLAPLSVDMVFIDAEKTAYPEYLGLAYPALAVGGLLIADDALLRGDFSVEGDEAARSAISTYLRAVARSDHLFSALIGTDNGLLVSLKH